MFVCDYEDGKWDDPRIIPYKPIEIEPSANVFIMDKLFLKA